MKQLTSYLVLTVVVVFALILFGCGGRKILHSDAARDLPLLTNKRTDKKKEVRVWFVRPKGDELELVPVTRSVGSSDQLEEAVKQLLRGPSEDELNSGLASEIPKGTILIAVKDGDDDVNLNLSRRFVSGGGTSSFETRLEQLKRTVSEVAKQRRVYLDVEGERLLVAGEGLEIKQPIN